MRFVIKGHLFALQIAKGMLIAASTNPLAALGILMAVAAGPPGWVGLVAAVAAQGMAMAAGIRDPHTLAIIGVVAGAAAGGLTAVLKGAAKYGGEELAKAAGAPQWLVSAASLGISLVNSANQDPDLSEDGSNDHAAGGSTRRAVAGTTPDGAEAVQFADSDVDIEKGIRELQCRNESREAWAKEVSKIPGEVVSDRDLPLLPPTRIGPGVIGFVLRLFGIVSPMEKTDQLRVKVYEECMRRGPSTST